MTSILFLPETIYCNIFRRIYLRNEKYFLDLFFFIFFVAFSKVRLNFEQIQKKDDPPSWCIFGLSDFKKRG